MGKGGSAESGRTLNNQVGNGKGGYQVKIGEVSRYFNVLT